MEKSGFSLYQSFLYALRHHYYRMHMLLDQIDIYPGQPPLLMILSKYDGLSQKKLADILRIKPATITVMIKRMEKVGLIIRKIDDVDKRKFQVFLTDKGKEKWLQVKEINQQLEKECFENFSEEEKVILRRLMLQMSDNLEVFIGKNCEGMERND